MKFWRDFLAYWIGESALITAFVWFVIKPTSVGMHFNPHGVFIAFSGLFGFIGLLSLSIAWSNSIRRSEKEYSDESNRLRALARTNELIGYSEEREALRRAGRTQQLTIETYVPSKWRFVDLETKTTWKWKDGNFVEDTRI